MSPSLCGTAEDVIKVHLVADTVPLGTTFCQKVPKGSTAVQKIVLLNSTILQHMHTSMVVESLLTHKTATSQVQLVPSRGHPYSPGGGTNQTGLTLCVL